MSTDDSQMLVDTYRRPLTSGLPPSQTLIGRLRRGERAAAQECIDQFGTLIWALAKKQSRSLQEAELVTEKIFEDIWHYAGKAVVDARESDRSVVERIAVRRIITHKYENRNIF